MDVIIDLDDDGYPTDECLDSIEKAELKGRADCEALLDAVAPLFEGYGVHERREDGSWRLVTGGWSGCESVICAINANFVLRGMYWYQSSRGGEHIYAPPGWNPLQSS